MEIDVDDYGKHLFSSMLEKKGTAGQHWESIRSKAEPLVRELIRLNSEMKGGGYKLVGYKDESGKEILPDHKRITKAQEELWSVYTADLKVGDRIWLLNDCDFEMHIGEQEPGKVEEVTGKAVYVELYSWEEFTQKLPKNKNTKVLRAPKNWEDKEEEYTSDEYWLKQADKLGI